MQPPQKKGKPNPDHFLTEFDRKKRDMKKLYLAKHPSNQGDNKRCLNFMDAWFPVTSMTGEMENYMAQISKLKGTYLERIHLLLKEKV